MNSCIFLSSMKRKIIELGHDCMVVSLPKKWVVQNGLKKGQELEVVEEDELLSISSQSKTQKPREITLTIVPFREAFTRTMIVNNYRLGYDRIYLHYSGKRQDIIEIVDKHILGFEVFHKGGDDYIIESVSEPNYDQFANIINKIFYIMLDMLDHIFVEDILEQTIKVQRYDNFLKRCISKNHYSPQSKPYLWQLLSELAHVSRDLYHFNLEIKKPLHPSQLEQKAANHLRAMISIIHQALQTKRLENMQTIYSLDHSFMKNMKLYLEKIPDKTRSYYYIHIARQLFLMNSPVMGVITAQ